MAFRLVVAAGEVVRLRELQAYSGQFGPPSQDCLESLDGSAWHAELHLEPAEQEESLDRFLLVGGFGLLEECARMLEAAGPDEHPGGLHVGEIGRWLGRPANGVGPRRGRNQVRDCERGVRGDERARQSALLLFADERSAHYALVSVSNCREYATNLFRFRSIELTENITLVSADGVLQWGGGV